MGPGAGRTRRRATASSPWFGVRTSASCERRTLEAVRRGRVEDRRRPGDAGDAQRFVGRAGPDLVTDQHDVALLQFELLERGRTWTGVERRVRAAGDRDLFSPASSTTIRATPVASSGSVTSPATSTPSASSAARAAVPNASSPTAPMKNVRAPSRAAATAWLPPLPPWCCAKRPPMTVSPGSGKPLRRDDEVLVDRADDDDPASHRRTP